MMIVYQKKSEDASKKCMEMKNIFKSGLRVDLSEESAMHCRLSGLK